MEDKDTRFKAVVADNEQAAKRALDRGDFLQAFLLVHSLVESLLRVFLGETGARLTFDDLIKKYGERLRAEHYPTPKFVDELTQFNRRRNRIMHRLWEKGYTLTNKWAEPAASAAVIMYGLLIEWIETFEPEIGEKGYRYT